MEPTSSASIRAARWFLAGLFAISLYRAATQSVTPAEAWDYTRFIGAPWVEALARTEALARFDVNHHVLNTLLVRISTACFHLTELSLRLPSLLAGGLYLWVVFRMARHCFGDGVNFLAVLGLLTLNPLVVDALSEANGNGMALTAFLWALELLVGQALPPANSTQLNLAGMCLGLSVAASLAFAAPVGALLIVLLLWTGKATQARILALTALLTAFILLVIPLNHADWGTLAGATSLRQTINRLTEISLGTSLKVIDAVARVALAVLACAAAFTALSHWRQRDGALPTFAGATLALTLVLLLAAHRWLHTPFPESAIYLIPLTVLSLMATILKRRNRTAQIAVLLLSAVLLVSYLSEFRFGMYADGRQFAGARTLAKTLRARAGKNAVRIGAGPAAEPIMSYYRIRYRQGNWQLVDLLPLKGTCDYYVLTSADTALIGQRHLQELYRDGGLTLAK